ncbi:MAG: class I SAM-dependent methyltransferase [Bacteroidetes bacterium]|nr:class I SAM-dependent methyltransferase [Bacteroidota bacterium]
MALNNEVLDLGNLQFYWRMTTKPNFPTNVVSDFLPFAFTYDASNCLIKQQTNQLVLDSLERIYKENYNVGYLQEGHSLAEAYGNDFIEIIEKSITQYNPTLKEIREIGAGGCYILKKLKSKGYKVSALDPSPVAHEKGKEFGIEVYQEFYPTKSKLPQADMYIHYDVLEHVEDPVGFLAHHYKELSENGLVVFAVPDCTSYIENGDISMILHEHINYYDKESLTIIARKAGFKVHDVVKANYGGVLYCIAQKLNNYKANIDDQLTDVSKFTEFVTKHKKLIVKINSFITNAQQANKSVGFYIPLRSIPYLSILGVKQNIRFFDDDGGIYGKYFDGFPIAVENFADLQKKPVDSLLVLSFAFGEKIKQKVLATISSSIDVKTISNLASE